MKGRLGLWALPLWISCAGEAEVEMPSTKVRTPTPRPTAVASVAPAAVARTRAPSPTPPPPSPASPGSQATPGETQVRETLERWRQAWESRDIDRYIAFYAEDFRSDGRDRAAWARHKGGVFSRLDQISVKVSGLSVEWKGELAVVEFDQEYQGGTRRDLGRKHMELKRVGGAWKIVNEEFER